MRITFGTLILLILVITLSSSQFVIQVRAVDEWVPGVHAGDWAKYELSFNYSTNDPDSPFSLPDEVNDIEYYRIEVLSVIDVIITFQLTTNFRNGTETSYVGKTDVTGASYPFMLVFIAANLSAEDPVYPFPGCTFVLNDTFARVYAGVSREVNYLSLPVKGYYPEGYESVGKSDVYWDRASGIFDEIVGNVQYKKVPEGHTTNATSSVSLVETNIWAPEAVSAAIDFFPKLLNLRSQGNWIMAVIRLAEGYRTKDINVSTIMLNDTIPAESLLPRKCNDHGPPILIVKFDRRAVSDLILKNCPSMRRLGKVTLTITGSLKNGTQFKASNIIWIVNMRTSMLHRPSKPLSYR